MSTPQDSKMTTAGAENASTSQDTGEKSASPPQDRASASSVSQTNTDPDDPVGNPDHIPLGYSLDPDAPPGSFDHLDMYPGISINRNQNMENMFKNLYTEMIENFEKGDDKAAEAIADELLSWGNLPVLYRTYAHVILAYGPVDGLHHAEKAVEEAQWGLDNYGDQSIGVKLLAIAEQTLKDVMGDDEVDGTEEVTGEDEEGG